MLRSVKYSCSVGIVTWCLISVLFWLSASPAAAFLKRSEPFCTLGEDFPNPEAALLVFSDHPECVREDGLLCQGGLLSLRPVRFQFYHQGGRDTPLFLVLRLRNRGTQRALISAVGGVGLGTEDNYFLAGHNNNMEFLPNLLRGRGSLIELQPGETAAVWTQRLEKEIVASGTVQWCLLQGRQVDYELYSCSSPEGPFYAHLLFNSDDVHARGIYPETQRRRESCLEIGNWQSEKDQVYWAVGATRQPSAFSGPELKGDYGVLYGWKLQLNNNGDENKNVEFAFNPRGGKATGTFMVNLEGAWEMWECAEETEAFQFKRLKVLTVPAHSSVRLTVYTIPEGASNYPVRLVLRCQQQDS